MTTTIETSEAESKALQLCDDVQQMVILSPADRVKAESYIASLKGAEDTVFEYLDPARERAFRDYQFHKKRLDDAIKPIQEARKLAKAKCMGYDSEQERLRREEDARLREIARKQAEEEQLAMAMQAEAEGDKDVAEAILAAPVDVAPASVPRTGPAPSRLTAGRKTWSCECYSPMDVVKAAAAGNAIAVAVFDNDKGREFIEGQLRGIVIAQKEAFRMPGCRAKEKIG